MHTTWCHAAAYLDSSCCKRFRRSSSSPSRKLAFCWCRRFHCQDGAQPFCESPPIGPAQRRVGDRACRCMGWTDLLKVGPGHPGGCLHHHQQQQDRHTVRAGAQQGVCACAGRRLTRTCVPNAISARLSTVSFHSLLIIRICPAISSCAIDMAGLLPRRRHLDASLPNTENRRTVCPA